MIPFFGAQTISLLGLFSIRVWGTLVALGYGIGTWIAYRRAKTKGLNADHILTIAVWMFFAAMVGSRLFHAFVYEPGYYFTHPLEAIDPRLPGYAITGGFLGAVSVFFLYVKRHKLDWIAYADTLAWGLPWGCGIGRIGCFLIHDHPGTLTHFVLGVRYPDGEVRHDLGLYLSLVGFGVGCFFLLLDKKPRPPGFWFVWFFVADGLSRFFLDFFRVADARYAGFTPAQWMGVLVVGIGGIWFWRTYAKNVKK